MTRSRIVEAARSFLGTPFHHQGRTKGHGIDCAGLIVGVAAEIGAPVEDHPTRDYSRFPTKTSRFLPDFCRRSLDEVAEAREGSVYLFWIHAPKYPQHLAIRTADDTIIHAYYDAKMVLETPIGDYWSSRVYSIFDFRGV